MSHDREALKTHYDDDVFIFKNECVIAIAAKPYFWPKIDEHVTLMSLTADLS